MKVDLKRKTNPRDLEPVESPPTEPPDRNNAQQPPAAGRHTATRLAYRRYLCVLTN